MDVGDTLNIVAKFDLFCTFKCCIRYHFWMFSFYLYFEELVVWNHCDDIEVVILLKWLKYI